jgi:hypothetical protein
VIGTILAFPERIVIERSLNDLGKSNFIQLTHQPSAAFDRTSAVPVGNFLNEHITNHTITYLLIYKCIKTIN